MKARRLKFVQFAETLGEKLAGLGYTVRMEPDPSPRQGIVLPNDGKIIVATSPRGQQITVVRYAPVNRVWKTGIYVNAKNRRDGLALYDDHNHLPAEAIDKIHEIFRQVEIRSQSGAAQAKIMREFVGRIKETLPSVFVHTINSWQLRFALGDSDVTVNFTDVGVSTNVLGRVITDQAEIIAALQWLQQRHQDTVRAFAGYGLGTPTY